MNDDETQLGEFYFADKDDLEIESNALALLIWAHEDAAPAVSEMKLHQDYFSKPFGLVFEAIQRVSDAGLPVHYSVLMEDLRSDEEAKQALAHIMSNKDALCVPTTWAAPLFRWLSLKIRKLHFDREQLRASQDLSAAIVSRDSPALADARARLDELEITSQITDALEIDQAIIKAIDVVEKAVQDKKDVLSTGLEKLDRFTTGFQEGEFWVVGARPSFGKTALALNIFDAVSNCTRAHFISLEMTLEQLVMRWNVMHSGVPMSQMIMGEGYTKQDLSRISNAFSHIRGHDAALNDDQQLSELQALRNEIITAAKKGAKVIFIDYLQLITAKNQRDKRQEIDKITKTLKRLAMQFRISIVALAQLNRGSDGKTPTMGDLKESSGIEQDADKIILIDRPNKSNDEMHEETEQCYLILAKQRNGVTGDIAAEFNPVRMRFTQGNHVRKYD